MNFIQGEIAEGIVSDVIPQTHKMSQVIRGMIFYNFVMRQEHIVRKKPSTEDRN